MSTVDTAAFGQPVEFPHGSLGPVTAARYRRNAKVYGAICVLAFLPFLFGAGAGWKALGLGLLVPGGGFLAVGGASILLFPLTLALFWLACVAWFWAGMVIAPLAVWLGAALLAAAFVGPEIWGPSFVLTSAAVGGIYYWFRRRAQQRQVADRERFKLRQSFFAQSRVEVDERVQHAPVAGERELSEDQIAAVRYVIDRALAPVGSFKGFTIIDQFQPAALRYQLNHMGFALGMLQGHYAPNFHAWLATAQRNLIECYLLPKVWDYWVLESMWGHFNFKNFDPAAKDNIMLTGWFGMHVNQYMLNSGDRRYAEPGSLTFRLNDQVAFAHSSHTLAQSVLDNLKRSDFCLYPCEPNWVYPICNMYGMGSLAAHDAVFDTDYARGMLAQWRNMLDSEFTDEKGSIVGLRSYWTGLEVPFYAGEAGFAFFANVFSPALGRKLWAIGRKELAFCLVDDGAGNSRLYFPPGALGFIDTIDPGHYRRGKLFPYAAVAMSAREFGDDDLAAAAMNAADRDCGRIMQDGVLFYSDASCLANVWAVEARLMRCGDFRNSFVRGPGEGALRGPVVAQASYPDVLVAKAVSSGEDLDLVLYPGRGAGRQTLGLARLKAGASYRLTGATSSELRADDGGCARLEVDLNGRTALRLVPA